MDSANDSCENYRFDIEDAEIDPIIALNHKGSADTITKGSLCLSDDGTYTCFAAFKVVY